MMNKFQESAASIQIKEAMELKQDAQLAQLGLRFVKGINLSASKFINMFHCNNYTGLCLTKIWKHPGNIMTNMDKSKLAFH